MNRGDVYLAIISHARAANVPLMPSSATWFVGAGEGPAYRAAGAKHVVESGGLCESRNAALRAAWAMGLACVQLSDDLRKVQVAQAGEKKNVAVDAPFEHVLRLVREGMRSVGAWLGGSAPTANPFYSNVERPVHPSAFIVGDFIVVNPCDVFFDERLKLKEDYDYTLQHLTKFGAVARRDDVLMTFAHRTNAGGAVAARTPALEQESIAHLKRKWPAFIRDNPRRPDEILLKLPRVKR